MTTSDVPVLLCAMLLAPYPTYGETFHSPGYETTGMFKNDYPYSGQRPFGASEELVLKSNRIAPSFKREFNNTDYYAASQRQDLQQHLLHMGFKFRAIPGQSAPPQVSTQFRPQITSERTEYPWRPVDGSIGSNPKFRPLSTVESNKSNSLSARGVDLIGQAPAVPYVMPGYAAELPGYTSIIPVFRPTP